MSKLLLTGQLVTFEWKVEDLNIHNHLGHRMVAVHEIYHGDDVPDPQKFGPMPGFAAESFIRVRRIQAQRMMSEGGHVKIITN